MPQWRQKFTMNANAQLEYKDKCYAKENDKCYHASQVRTYSCFWLDPFFQKWDIVQGGYTPLSKWCGRIEYKHSITDPLVNPVTKPLCKVIKQLQWKGIKSAFYKFDLPLCLGEILHIYVTFVHMGWKVCSAHQQLSRVTMLWDNIWVRAYAVCSIVMWRTGFFLWRFTFLVRK
jgi:hypothetical protein